MNYLKEYRIRIAAFLLKQKLKKSNRKPVICNLHQAKSIALIFDSLSNNDLKTVKKFESSLKDQNIKVEILGFSNIKRNGETLIGDKRHHYVYINDFNWIYKPKNQEIQSFLTNSYDILINLYQQDNFAVEMMVKISKAKFKVGCAHLDTSLHDLMIDVGHKKGNSDYLSEQINRYLNIIHG